MQFVQLCGIALILVFLAMDDACAQDDGIYFHTQLGYIDKSEDWYDNGGIPARLEFGYRIYEVDFFGSPSVTFSLLHLSNFEGGLLAEVGGDEGPDESSLNFWGVGLCWGAC